MLTCCGCVANKEQTQILTPCQLHEAWAKAKYASGLTVTGQVRHESTDATR